MRTVLHQGVQALEKLPLFVPLKNKTAPHHPKLGRTRAQGTRHAALRHAPGEVDLVALGDDAAAAGAQVVHEASFAHELRHDVDGLAQHHAQQLHQVLVPQ